MTSLVTFAFDFGLLTSLGANPSSATGDVYKVVPAMAPLYFALGLGYGSVRRWKVFTPDQCDAVNRLVAYFTVPFFAFGFAARMDSYALNYRVLAAVALALAAWAVVSTRCCSSRGDGAKKRGGELASSWCITGFSLATLNNTLVVGVPLLDAMYGGWARDLVVQISVVQIIVYFPLLLMAFEARRACGGGITGKPDAAAAPAGSEDDDVEDGGVEGRRPREPVWPLVRAVGLKVAQNPNVYAGVLGVAWSCITIHKQVAHPDAKHHRGLRPDHVPDRGWPRHVQHGLVHGAAEEDHSLRGRPDRAGHGAAVRRRPGGHRRRSRRSGAPRRRPSSGYHTGCSPSVHYHVRVRQGVRPPR